MCILSTLSATLLAAAAASGTSSSAGAVPSLVVLLAVGGGGACHLGGDGYTALVPATTPCEISAAPLAPR